MFNETDNFLRNYSRFTSATSRERSDDWIISVTRFKNFYRRSFSRVTRVSDDGFWICRLYLNFPPILRTLLRHPDQEKRSWYCRGLKRNFIVKERDRSFGSTMDGTWTGSKVFLFEKREKSFLRNTIENGRLLPSWKFALIVRNFPKFLRVVYNGTK